MSHEFERTSNFFSSRVDNVLSSLMKLLHLLLGFVYRINVRLWHSLRFLRLGKGEHVERARQQAAKLVFERFFDRHGELYSMKLISDASRGMRSL